MNTKVSKLRAGIAVSAAMIGTVVLTAQSPASAATARNGVCESGEICIYYNSDRGGSVSDFTTGVPNWGTGDNCYVFKGPGLGQGFCMWDNNASFWNRTSRSVNVCTNTSYTGTCRTISPGAYGNFGAALKNNGESHGFLL